MGYWIYHEKATLDKKSNVDACGLSSLNENKTDLGLFEKYIQKVELKVLVDTVLVVNNFKLFKEEKLRLNHQIFHKSQQKMIEKHILKNKYNLLTKEVSTNTAERTIYSFYNYETKDGMYTEKIFESPFKDCCAEFYQKYFSGINYSEFSAFKKACELEYDKWRYPNKEDFVNELNLFKENLIDKYEHGKSILSYF